MTWQQGSDHRRLTRIEWIGSGENGLMVFRHDPSKVFEGCFSILDVVASSVPQALTGKQRAEEMRLPICHIQPFPARTKYPGNLISKSAENMVPRGMNGVKVVLYLVDVCSYALLHFRLGIP